MRFKMASKTLWFLVVILFFNFISAQLNAPDDECLKCICHGVTGCYRMANCGSYSVSLDYWRKSGIGTLDYQYHECLKSTECIKQTIKEYARTIEDQDCDNNEVVDCNDYFLIHKLGTDCKDKRKRDKIYMSQVNRYDSCMGTSTSSMRSIRKMRDNMFTI